MLSGVIKLTLRLNLWDTFDGRLLHGLDNKSLGINISTWQR